MNYNGITLNNRKETNEVWDMKIVFLDIDGVLNNSFHNEFSRHHGGLEFAPSCVANIIELLNETDAKVVITSTWRIRHTVDSLNRKVLTHYGLADYVVGHTPVLDDCPRGEEIKTFLENTNLLIDRFIIIDDDNDMGEFLGRLVRTNNRKGFTSTDKEKALKLLRE